MGLFDDIVDTATGVAGEAIKRGTPKTVKKVVEGEDVEVEDVVEDVVVTGIAAINPLSILDD